MIGNWSPEKNRGFGPFKKFKAASLAWSWKGSLEDGKVPESCKQADVLQYTKGGSRKFP